ncbi:NAD(P)H-hydrate dehydratase [Paludibacteraceae bacterium OttesenSCG-928-F17]|nr:NAD(P)H-hydrate dehydratase [Paludibacteraceae bacterium OttesenSCG-928-F17]
MKVLTGNQIKEADQATIKNEPISSYDLMERASRNIAYWISRNIDKGTPLLFLIGKGNNGGDGLAVARILSEKDYSCSITLLFPVESFSEESSLNYKNLPKEINIIEKEKLDKLSENTIIIDAILGTGVKGEITEPLSGIINKINCLPNKVISIDIPSGMKTEFGNTEQIIVKADITLTLEFPKIAMLLTEAGNYCGDIHIIPIGLDKEFIQQTPTPYFFITSDITGKTLRKREKFAHKGTYGHALLICGSKGMMGAASLATGGALRSGCGLVTAHIPQEERFSLQTSFPSSLLSLDNGTCFSELPANLEKYTSIGIGSGLSKSKETVQAFTELLNGIKIPLVLDADALNILAENKQLLKLVPKNSILTPHIGELKRLTGEWKDEQEKIKSAGELAKALESIVVVKGAYTMITFPNGQYLFNSTGNAGMAKGGSGDVLTGFIAGLLARGYSSEEAAILGVYFHGLAGDKAAEKYGMESMNSFDMIKYLRVEM